MPISSSSLPPLVFEPRWSVQRWIVVAVQCVGCVDIPWLIPHWSIAARVVLTLLALGLLAMGYQQAGWWGAKRLMRIIWQQSGHWVLQQESEEHDASSGWELSPNSFVTSWLMVLRWQRESSSISVVILPKELPMNLWRQWQARLKLQGCKVLHASDTEP